jgi:transcriptional regulator with XRE-family HTH domain
MPRPKGQSVDGAFIRSRRELAQLTQDALASRCDLTRALIQKAERGGPLSPKSISSIASALGVADASLVIDEGWQGFVEERVLTPFKPESEPKVGSLWVQPRETLYSLSPLLLQIIGLRSAARVLPAFAPRSADGAGHLRRIVQAIARALAALDCLIRERPVEIPPLRQSADHAYLAASFARPNEYEEDVHAADAAFAVGIALARVLDSLVLELTRTRGKKDADHWRAVELATSACHACGHASVYLKASTPFLRAATLDTHDVRNMDDLHGVLTSPLWTDGQLPPVLELYMARFIRLQYFDSASRAKWSGWARKGFA